MKKLSPIELLLLKHSQKMYIIHAWDTFSAPLHCQIEEKPIHATPANDLFRGYKVLKCSWCLLFRKQRVTEKLYIMTVVIRGRFSLASLN